MKQTMKEVELYLVRHGQTYINKYNRMQGWSDSPLTASGKSDAHNAGISLRDTQFQAVYSSDTMRAIKTAKIIMDESNVPTPERRMSKYLREHFYGYFEGDDSYRTWFVIGNPYGYKTLEDIAADRSLDAAKDLMNQTDPYHDAENAERFWTRVNKGLDQLLTENPDHSRILVVTHGGLIRSLAAKYGRTEDGLVHPTNGSLTRMSLTDEGAQITIYNQTLKPYAEP
jgi:probable phosphoglycerate mutase